MRAGDRTRRGDFGRARHRPHQAGVSRRRDHRDLRRLQEQGRSGRALQQGQAPAGRRPAQCLHAVVQSCWKPSRSSSKQSEIGAIADSIKDCLRCGKCKPVCNTHIPRANLLYSPRNKILATSLLIEAFLYEEQTRRGVSLKHFDEFSDVADHCTICHKCKNPCPVDIDFGDVSIAMRNLLRKQGKKKFNPGTWASMAFLNATDPATIKALRKPLIEWGYASQRLGHQLFKRMGLIQAQTKQPTRHRWAGPSWSRRSSILSTSRCRAGCRRKPRARCWAWRIRRSSPSCAIPHKLSRRVRRGVLLPRLRFGAAVLAGGARHPGDAVRTRRADRAAARLPVLRLSADRGRPGRQGRGRSPRPTACCSTASPTRSTISTSRP